MNPIERPPGGPRRRAGAATGRLWLALSLLFFGGLAALEVARGLGRLDSQRERHRRELIELLERQAGGLAREVEELLGQGESHAAHLARNPLVRDVLREPSEGNASALERLLLPYLVSFRGIDRICVLDGAGVERVRCERMGTGVAAIPAGHLADAPRTGLAGLVEGAAPGEVVVSPLLDDAQRVEVAEADRLVFHYACRTESDGRALGTVVVTAYAAPLLHALAEFEPLPGVTAALFDGAGELVAAPRPLGPDVLSRGRELVSGGAGERGSPAADAVLLLSDPLRRGPAARLVTVVPAAALAAAVAPPRGETLRVALTTVAVVALIALGSAFFVRASLRSQRLRETEHYLERIRNESRKHRALMEAAADLILVVDPEADRVHDWNPRAKGVLGLERSPGSDDGGAPLESVRAAFPGEGFEALRACVGRAVERPGEPSTAPALAARGADGERLELDARCVAIEYGDERMVEVLLVDRTRERDMERRMRTAERLSSLGLLTAGVAHEINNPLEGIANYLSLLEKHGLAEDRRARYVGLLRQGFQRIRDIVGDLLSFARPGPDPGVADLSRVVRSALGVARYAKDLRSVHLDVHGLDEPLEVPGSEGRLEQVILNLVLNAGRAMEGRGTIRVRAHRADPEWVELSVEDEGPGIAGEDLERIFDPFFTRAGGSGLGLAVSYGIVQAHGGLLEARNGAEGGARLVLRLPRRAPGGPHGETSREA